MHLKIFFFLSLNKSLIDDIASSMKNYTSLNNTVLDAAQIPKHRHWSFIRWGFSSKRQNRKTRIQGRINLEILFVCISPSALLLAWWWSASLLQIVPPPDAHPAAITPPVLAGKEPQRASRLNLVELALSLWKYEFTGTQKPKLNKNSCSWLRNLDITFAEQKHNQFINHNWKVLWFMQEGRLECKCRRGWAIIDFKNVN